MGAKSKDDRKTEASMGPKSKDDRKGRCQMESDELRREQRRQESAPSCHDGFSFLHYLFVLQI